MSHSCNLKKLKRTCFWIIICFSFVAALFDLFYIARSLPAQSPTDLIRFLPTPMSYCILGILIALITLKTHRILSILAAISTVIIFSWSSVEGWHSTTREYLSGPGAEFPLGYYPTGIMRFIPIALLCYLFGILLILHLGRIWYLAKRKKNNSTQ